MKITKITRKYLHVRMTQEEYDLLESAITKHERDQKKERERDEYARWWFSNHVEINWEDEYSSSHTDWTNIHTGKSVQSPGFWVTMCRIKYVDIIKKTKKDWKNRNKSKA